MAIRPLAIEQQPVIGADPEPVISHALRDLVRGDVNEVILVTGSNADDKPAAPWREFQAVEIARLVESPNPGRPPINEPQHPAGEIECDVPTVGAHSGPLHNG